MKRALALLCAAFCATFAGQLRAEGDAAKAQAAAAFDQARGHYRAGRFEAAASKFEAADDALPSARAVRMAIRSRAQAGQQARATTLAAQALLRYPEDKATRELAEGTVAAHGESLHRLEVSCSKPCVVALGSDAVPGAPRDRWVVYVDPGQVTVSASFGGGAGSEEQVLNASAGGRNALSFLPSPGKRAPAVVPSATPEPKETVPPPDEPSWIEHPAVFGVLVAATAGLGGVTIWSGIDTLNNPGADTVREECRGKGTDCPEYQLGRDKQLRTNILIGATAGVAAITLLVGVLVTEWGGDDEEPAPSDASRPKGPELSVYPGGLQWRFE